MGQGKDKQQRTRRTATAGEHNKKADKRAKQAEKQRVAEQQAGVAARRSFLSRAGAGSGSSSAAARGAEGVTADSEGGGNADEDLESGVGNGGQAAGAAVDADAAAAEEDPEEDHEEAGGEARREARPADVEAELDDEDGEPEAVEGVMATYLKAVFDRLHSETTGEASRDVLLYPEWSNASDYVSTPEGFGTVAIHSAELAAALDAIELPPASHDQPYRLTTDQRYLCKTMGTKLPLLPVHGEAECKLFERLVLTMPTLDFDAMAIAWCNEVDGRTIFPKLPVYLRTHHTAWLRNQRVRDAVEKASTGEAKL